MRLRQSIQPVQMKPNTWKIVEREHGTFEIFHRGELLKASIPEKWLEAELGKYGFCGQAYFEIYRDLRLHGKAERTL